VIRDLRFRYYDVRICAQKELIWQDFAKVFEKVDALIAHVACASICWVSYQIVANVSCRYLHHRSEPGRNLRNQCAMRFRRSERHRLPIGLQLLGKLLDEARILQIAHAYEQTDWHMARPRFERWT
jgi:aspartyl-tRNA(Asn)/glutamyl-tRNA(Gln) amidotransferase subunit A